MKWQTTKDKEKNLKVDKVGGKRYMQEMTSQQQQVHQVPRFWFLVYSPIKGTSGRWTSD